MVVGVDSEGNDSIGLVNAGHLLQEAALVGLSHLLGARTRRREARGKLLAFVSQNLIGDYALRPGVAVVGGNRQPQVHGVWVGLINLVICRVGVGRVIREYARNLAVHMEVVNGAGFVVYHVRRVGIAARLGNVVLN